MVYALEKTLRGKGHLFNIKDDNCSMTVTTTTKTTTTTMKTTRQLLQQQQQQDTMEFDHR